MSFQTLKGFRDFFPEEMAVRKEVMRRLAVVFEKYGFEELATPALEYKEVLMGKYGEEAEKLMYLFNDPGERGVGLKYDLTVPLARAVANKGDIALPFKRYQMQPVWRAENTQKGRYREFYQCDIDIVGSSSPLADGEILAVISDSLSALGFENFSICVNSRTVLFAIMDKANVPTEKRLTAIQSLDKLDKKTKEEVQEELSKKGFDSDQITNMFQELGRATPDEYLTKTIETAEKLGAINIVFSPAISRGLDYYTGPIFETIVTEPKIGSLTGGGRYDNLLKTLGGPDLPAVGTTIGLERIIDVITELNLWPEISKTTTQALVTIFNESLEEVSIETAKKLRARGINTELYPTNAKLEKQLKYADRKKLQFVIIIGEEEVANGKVVVKNLVSGEQSTVSLEEAVSIISK
ncbi:histidine--tRNA ligase [Candidatus Woesebacteria bacterium]|nr:histidine--tRNA ligase [Candidatus Woesebacteria bacterium]